MSPSFLATAASIALLICTAVIDSLWGASILGKVCALFCLIACVVFIFLSLPDKDDLP